jgi:biopolymer transport protein ExbD
MTREVYRVFSISFTYDIWLLSKSEVDFYNLIFAFIAVIVGQSMCFVYWFDRPRSFKAGRGLRRVSVVNDQRTLNWFFLSWFSKLGVAFGAMFSLRWSIGYRALSLSPEFNYMFILIVIVLFLQTWVTLRLTFRRTSLKWMIASMFVVSILSFGLSRINLIDYKALNQMVLQENIRYKYNLELPESRVLDKYHKYRVVEDIYIVESRGQKIKSRPVVVIRNQKVAIEDIAKELYNPRLAIPGYFNSRAVYLLHVHKNVKTGFVNKVKAELSKLKATRIAYAVVPAKRDFPDGYYENYLFRRPLIDWSYEIKDIELWRNAVEEGGKVISVVQNDMGVSFVNDSMISWAEFKPFMKNLLRRNPEYIVVLYGNNEVIFEDHFRVLSYTREVVDELRNEYALKKFGEQYVRLNVQGRRMVKLLYPYYITELPEEIVAILGHKVGAIRVE